MHPRSRRLLDRLGSASAILTAPEALLERIGIAAAARRLSAQAPFCRAQRSNAGLAMRAITCCRSPIRATRRLLHGLTDRPIALYVAGNIEVLSDPQLAVVGSRNPTPQGSDTAFEFAHYLAERGLGIVSGLARGIDAAAHRGALAAQGITLAVLGSGLDVIYPRSTPGLERGDRAARRPGQRVSAANSPPARQFSAAQPHHRSVESRDPGGRGGAQERLA